MEKELQPQLRFPEFENGWIPKKHNEIYRFYSTNSLSRDKLNYENGQVKNIHYGDIHTRFSTLFDISNETVPFINNNILISNISSENYCKEGDLIIADASEDYTDIGKTLEIFNLNNEKVLAGLHTFLARPEKQAMALGFAGFMLQSWYVRRQIMKIAQGTKVLGLAKSRLGKINLIIPCLQEQQKIASFLAVVDNKLTQLTKKKALLEQYKKGMMQQFFSQEIRFKDDDGKDYPEWQSKHLGEVLKIGSGRDYKHLGNGAIPVFGSGGIMTKVNEFIYDGESVGIGRKGTIDKPVFLTGKFWTVDTLFFTHSFRKVLPKFIYYIFNTINWYRYNEASGVPSLSKKTIEKIPVKIPCIQEQAKITNFLSALDDRIIQVDYQIEKTTAYKKGLLQQMFV